MRSEAPPLLPVFRPRHQAELLIVLLLRPEREYTQTELAHLVKTPVTPAAVASTSTKSQADQHPGFGHAKPSG
jgi:hypothetical protein